MKKPQIIIQFLLLIISTGFGLFPFFANSSKPVKILDEYSYQSELGEYIGLGEAKTYRSDVNKFTLTGNKAALSLNVQTPSGYWQIKLAAPKGETLQLGHTAQIEPTSYRVETLPALQVSSNGLECNSYFGEFTLHQLDTNSDGTIASLYLEFSQHCEAHDTPALRGVVKYHLSGNNK